MVIVILQNINNQKYLRKIKDIFQYSRIIYVFLSCNVLDNNENRLEMQNDILMETQRIDKINIQGMQLCYSFVRFLISLFKHFKISIKTHLIPSLPLLISICE